MSIIAQALEKAEKSARGAGKTKRFRPGIPEVKEIKAEKRRPSMQGATVIFLVLLIAAAAYAVNRSLITGGFTAKTPAAREISEVRGIADAPSAALPPLAEAKESAKILPTVPKALTPDDVKDMVRLTGIMYTPERPLAVVNDAVWSEGEHVGDFKILKIGEDFLKVDRDGSEFVLKLKR